jgi:DNA polymerase beta
MKSRGAGFLALTGDLEFNKDIRTRAVKLGMYLNEFGLWRWQTENDASVEGNGEQRGFWELVRAESEEEILREVGLECVEPEKRNFAFVMGKTKRGRPRKF